VSATREQIMTALFALVSTGEGRAGAFAWTGGGPFVYTSRRGQMWDAVSQPSLMQIEHDENRQQAARMPAKLILRATWLIYHQSGNVQSTVPAIVTNNIIDAIEALLPTDDFSGDNFQTLGGLVERAWIDGAIIKENGDGDGQSIIMIPVSVLRP
jgi:hypothetical protein